MFKMIMKFIVRFFKSEVAREILKIGVDAYVEKNDNKLTNESAVIVKKILDEIE